MNSPTLSISPRDQAISDITVMGNEFAFVPSVITIQKGQTIRLTFKNSGSYPHDLVFNDINIQTKIIQPGEQDSVTFTADKTGTFSYTCTVGSHAEKGMTGTLIVEG